MYLLFIIYYQATRHLFVPAEKKIPKIRIETRQYDKLKDQRVIIAIDSWPRTSRYPLVCILYRIFDTFLYFYFNIDDRVNFIL